MNRFFNWLKMLFKGNHQLTDAWNTDTWSADKLERLAEIFDKSRVSHNDLISLAEQIKLKY